MSDPVHEDGGEWWFYTETWADREGPFGTEAEARDALERYAKWLNTGEDA